MGCLIIAKLARRIAKSKCREEAPKKLYPNRCVKIQRQMERELASSGTPELDAPMPSGVFHFPLIFRLHHLKIHSPLCRQQFTVYNSDRATTICYIKDTSDLYCHWHPAINIISSHVKISGIAAALKRHHSTHLFANANNIGIRYRGWQSWLRKRPQRRQRRESRRKEEQAASSKR